MAKTKTRKPKPVVVDVDRLRISFSGADTYLKCGHQYKLRYVEGIKTIPGIALLEGSSHHKAMEVNNLGKKKSGRDMKHGRLTEVFMEDFRDRVKKEEKGVNWGEEDEDNIFHRAGVLHERYINDVAPIIHPVEVERKFELPVDIPLPDRSKVSVLLTGVCDVEQKDSLSDYKTAARSKGQAEADNSLQLSLYAHASKKRTVGLIEFLKVKNPYVGVIWSTRTPVQTQWALQVVGSVAQGILRKSFPLAPPNSWACSERFCGYWNMCRGKRL